MDGVDSASFISPFRRWATLAAGCLLAILLIWGPLATLWPASLLAIGMDMMGTFFHELGHTVFSWIFGYPALPSFDFQHGGGMSWHLDRQMILQYGVLLTAAYGVWLAYWRHAGLGAAATLLFMIYAASTLTEFHNVIILFMGHGAEIAIGSYVLARVLFDAVPPRPGELEVHALAGCYLLCHPIQLSWGLIYDPDARDAYWVQKGSEGFGDFSRISDYFGFANETPVAWFCIGCAILGIITPILAKYVFDRAVV